jgi:hypothetical protein
VARPGALWASRRTTNCQAEFGLAEPCLTADGIRTDQQGTYPDLNTSGRHVTTSNTGTWWKVRGWLIRHSILLLQAGKTMTTVSKILGHSSVGVTDKIYAHAFDEEEREAVAAVTKRLPLMESIASERAIPQETVRKQKTRNPDDRDSAF